MVRVYWPFIVCEGQCEKNGSPVKSLDTECLVQEEAPT